MDFSHRLLLLLIETSSIILSGRCRRKTETIERRALAQLSRQICHSLAYLKEKHRTPCTPQVIQFALTHGSEKEIPQNEPQTMARFRLVLFFITRKNAERVFVKCRDRSGSWVM
jgi:hypothetical protein